jgi:hypothetical protein
VAKALVKWKKLADVGKSPPEQPKGKPDAAGAFNKGRVKAEHMYRQKVVTKGMPSRG